MNEVVFNQGLLNFLNQSPTPFHVVSAMAEKLEENGFCRLHEEDEWKLVSGNSYYVTRNDSAIIAFHFNGEQALQNGVKLFGAHTDSPCLKVKPNPVLNKSGCIQLGVETYGGVLLNPWFDRDLSLAGRVHFETNSGKLCSTLINFPQAIAIIPSLAIHLDREANEKRTVNKQHHMSPLIALSGSEEIEDFHYWLKLQLEQMQPKLDIAKVYDFELSFYDTQQAAIIGVNSEFIASARLDNLLSCYIGLEALLASDRKQTSILVCNDHEEVGSGSAVGADGPMLQSLLDRIFDNSEVRERVLAQSMMISVDNAHGVHPNYADKHDGNHGPQLNQGPVIKLNANQRYASNSETSAIFSKLCGDVNVPVQKFVVRSDMACGSTIGPITAANIGVKTVDVGVPQLAMHSIREMAGSKDSWMLTQVATRFFDTKKL